MSGKERRIEKLLKNPKDVDFNTIDLLLKNDFGYECKPKGRHFIYRKAGKRTICVARYNPVREYSVQEIIDELGLGRGD